MATSTQEFLIGPVMLSYVEGLWTKQQPRGSTRDPQYIVNAVITDPEAKQKLQAWVDYAMQTAHPGKTRDDFVDDHYPIKEAKHHKAYANAFPDCIWIRAKSNYQPTVLDKDRQTVIAVNGPDANNPGRNIIGVGTVAYLVVHIYGYTYNNRPGLQFGLNQVIKFADGTPFEERSGGDYSELLNKMPGEPGAASGPPATGAPGAPPTGDMPPGFDPNVPPRGGEPATQQNENSQGNAAPPPPPF
jgi:hypothetical protein